MIPKVIDPQVKSGAEKRIFDMFEKDPLTKDWIVMHSYGIEKHPTLPYGEIDFLVLAPNLGFFAFEVKGGRVSREHGMWIFTDKNNEVNTKSRGPFEQANEAIYGIMNHVSLIENQRNWKNYNFGFGVMFTDIIFQVNDLDADQKQVFDIRNGREVGKFVINLAHYLFQKYRDLNLSKIKPTVEDVKSFAYLIRQDFDITVSLNRKIEIEEQRILTLTAQQNMCIDGLFENPRCLINGLAGTGKTLLAVKYAKDSATKGEKVALFCYNLLLAEYMNEHFKEYPYKPVYIGSLTQFLEDIVLKYRGVSHGDYQDASYFYQSVLHALAIDVLIEHPHKFEKIILDEAQDLLTKDYCDILDLLLEGGLKHGSWYLFGDFTMQTIFNKQLDIDAMKKYLSNQTHYTNFTLTKNCRNSFQILAEMNKLVGINQPHEDGVIHQSLVKRIPFKEKQDQVNIVDGILDELIKEGIHKNQITLLSQYKFSDQFIEKLSKWKLKQHEYNHKGITYSTIQKFKGLENDIIILLDVYTYELKELIYIGMSRAKASLYILEKKN